MSDLKPIVVLGARRSGTNYVEALLQANTKHEVLNLNRDAADNSEYARRGSKHDLDVDLDTKLAGSINLVVVKNPLSWLVSRLRYEDDCCKVNPDHKRKPVHDIIHQEWNEFYNATRNKVHGIIRYEMVVSNPAEIVGGLRVLGIELSYEWHEKDQFQDIKQRIGPNRSVQSHQFSKPENPWLMYHNEFGNDNIKEHWLNHFDQDLLVAFGYDPRSVMERADG